MIRIHLTFSLFLILVPWANAQGDNPRGSVTGIVILEGDPPAPYVRKLKPDMQEVTGEKTLSIQSWLVGENGGLTHSVVTLMAKDGTIQAQLKPLENVIPEKDGPSFVPRLLVITKGTKVTYRNKNSPCKCFEFHGRQHPAVNRLIPAGSQYEM